MASMTATEPPALKKTYYPGKTLKLYPYPPPTPPTDERCSYGGSPRLLEIIDRYNKSIEERIMVPSTPPDVTITLEKRFDSSKLNIAHVWLAQVQGPSQTAYPSELVAKIYDPVWFDDGEWFQPFKGRDLVVSREVECYRRFASLQGTKVPWFYGHFIAPLPCQQNRTVSVILMQCMPGDDLRHIVPHDAAGAVCDAHKGSIIEAVLNFLLDIDAFGVNLMDMHPRNVILLPPGKRREFCDFPSCPLRLEADDNNLEIAMVDFESVEFTEPRWYDDTERRKEIDRSKTFLLQNWLEGYMG